MIKKLTLTAFLAASKLCADNNGLSTDMDFRGPYTALVWDF